MLLYDIIRRFISRKLDAVRPMILSLSSPLAYYRNAKKRKKRLNFLMKVRKIPKYRIAALLKSGKLVYTKIRFIDVDLYEDSCVLGSSLLLIKNEIEYLRERRRSFLFTQDGYMYNMGEVYLLFPVLASEIKESHIKSIKYVTVKRDKFRSG